MILEPKNFKNNKSIDIHPLVLGIQDIRVSGKDRPIIIVLAETTVVTIRIMVNKVIRSKIST